MDYCTWYYLRHRFRGEHILFFKVNESGYSVADARNRTANLGEQITGQHDWLSVYARWCHALDFTFAALLLPLQIHLVDYWLTCFFLPQ